MHGGGASEPLSIASSHSTDASIVPLDGDSSTATESSPLVSVIVISVVPLTPSRSPSVNADAARSYVHALSQSGRGTGQGYCTNEPNRKQCSRHQHGLSPVSICCSDSTRHCFRWFLWNTDRF